MTPEERGDLQATHVARYDGFSPQPEIPRDEGAPVRPRQPVRPHRLHAGGRRGRLRRSPTDPEAIGIAIGTGSAGAGRADRVPARAPPRVARRPRRRFTSPTRSPTRPASQVSIELKLYGPNVTITQKDPSALNALLFSALALASGRARAMLAGAVDEWNPFYAMGFDRVGALRGREARLGNRAGRGRLRRSCSRRRRAARARGAPAARAPRRHRDGGRGLRALPLRSRRAAMERAIRGALDDAGAAARRTSTSGSPRATASRRWTAPRREVMRAIFGDAAAPRARRQGRDRRDGRRRRRPARRGLARAVAARRRRGAPSSTPSAPAATSSPPSSSPPA